MEATMKELLATLNAHRMSKGMKPLRSWKASKAALEEAIAKVAPPKTGAVLPRIARELKIDPKKARAKLRKAHGSAWRKLNEKELRAELAA
jgi:hypothetical protein